jgi:hypothetical protein
MRTLFGTLLRLSGLAIHGVAVEHDLVSSPGPRARCVEGPACHRDV